MTRRSIDAADSMPTTRPTRPHLLALFPSRFRRLTFAAALLALGAAGASHARAQALLTFSGGNGTPLTLTLSSAVTYTITTETDHGPIFDIQSLGNFFVSNGARGYAAAGSMTFSTSLNPGVNNPLTTLLSGISTGDVNTTDTLIQGSFANLIDLPVGTTVTLNAGALTTSQNVTGRPANGSYTTFVVDDDDTRLDAVPGAAVPGAVPEPSTWALLGAGAASLGVCLRCQRRERTAA